MGGTLAYTQTGALPPGSGGNYTSLTVVTPGIYLFHFSINQNLTVSGSIAYVMIIGTNANAIHYGFNMVSNGSEIAFNGTQLITCTASNYNLQLNYAGFTFGNFSGFYYATRIA